MNVQYCKTICVSDYNKLRKSVGWSEIEETQALTGIKNSSYLVSAIADNQTVGMARVVSDGGYISIIVDVIVLPDYQGKGIGKTMMEKIMEHIIGSVKKGQSAFVNIMSAKGKESFYSRFGFEVRPNETAGSGMTRWIKRSE